MKNENLNIPTSDKIILSDESMNDFRKAMKIGYCKDFLKKGIITHSLFHKLIQRQNRKEE